MADPPTPPEAGGGPPAGEGRAEPLAAEGPRAATPAPATRAAAPPAKPAEHVKTAAAPAGPPDPAPPADAVPPAFVPALQQALPGAVEQLSLWVGDWTLIVSAPRLLDVARWLRDTPGAQFDFCSDVTASDWPPRPKRFDLVYCLYSVPLRHRIRLKARVGEGEPVASVSEIWPAANWLEREVFDLFGVTFTGHPDLRRILMPEDWQGHPQRKDYPLEGPGELLLESPIDWLKVKQAREIE